MSASCLNKKKILTIVKWSVIGLVLLILIAILSNLLIQKYIKKNPVPTFFGRAYLIVETGSMSSTIEIGDLVVVEKADEYKIGDIVTFVKAQGEPPTTHRIINNGPFEGTFETKGDNPVNSVDPGYIYSDQIAGKVVKTIPKIGLFFLWFAHGGGVIYVVAMFAIVIAGYYFWQLIKGEPEKEASSADKPEEKANPEQEKNPAESEKKSDETVQTKKDSSKDDKKS